MDKIKKSPNLVIFLFYVITLNVFRLLKIIYLKRIQPFIIKRRSFVYFLFEYIYLFKKQLKTFVYSLCINVKRGFDTLHKTLNKSLGLIYLFLEHYKNVL